MNTCTARLADSELILANDLIERRWRIDRGRLYATSFLHRSSNRQWCAQPATQPSFLPPTLLPNSPCGVTLTSSFATHRPTQRPSLLAVLTLTWPNARLVYHLQLLPDASGVRIHLAEQHLSTPAAGASSASATAGATGIETDPLPTYRIIPPRR